ncbi:iron-regulated protein [Nannocystis sp. ILAH1]|uniref:imelysin family protein n=1 Tax=unclassified Nannocystis TaxID=2627009 RepID=UPI00226EEA03|nr:MULTISPECIES: imelysin family protein [unclassified Nannocystis]MCY0990352.1 iron-regulated protein [Nannocystis sp. ILAH1]MCY1069359.1 iron-regulated protein [Nannocystis sp. RBIL2]
MRRSLLALCLLPACTNNAATGWDDDSFRSEAQSVVDRYAELVSAAYEKSSRGAEQMDSALQAFVAAPSAETLEATKTAWLGARDDYGLTEVFRFYNGPIDAAPDELEGRINAWPMDEAYIDYVEGEPDVGIINDLAGYPEITRDVLIERNGAEGEDSISTGWHAIEFLLWGQDLSADGPGARPWSDYVDGADGTAANQDRRRQYLTLTSELLLDDLARVADAWSEGQANYRADFVAQDPKEAIAKVLLGMASLSGAELAGERMTVAYDTREQEDEHSCFSDNTHKDLLANIQGIEDVYLGRIDGQAGASLSSLVARIDADVDAVATAKLQAAVAAVKAIPAPFDAAIQAKDGSPERAAVKAAIDSLKEATDALVAVADALEIELNLE